MISYKVVFAGATLSAVTAFFGPSALLAADKKSPPNILFAIADDWGLHASAYGTRWIKTPAFDRVAREGLLFKRAFTPNAKCSPSRASILTGRNSWHLEAAANHGGFFPPKFLTWGDVLVQKGWTVGNTNKVWSPGVAMDLNGKPRSLFGKAFNQRMAMDRPAKGVSKNNYAANFADFLDQAPKGGPWAFWYGGIEPHRPYEYGSGVASGGKKLSDIDRVPAYWPDNDTIRNDILDYAYEVEHFDRHLGLMLAELEKRGLLDNTLVVVTSDHGMPFPRVKGSVYAAANQVPLAAMWKRGIAAPGRKIEDYVSLIDLAPSFIEVTGGPWSKTGMAPSPGRSLTDIFVSKKSARVTAARDHVLLGMERHDVGRPGDVGYPVRGIVKGDKLLLYNYEPTRWPACDPETGYLNVDGSPTKTFILQAHRKDPNDRPWALAFGKRSSEEYYDLEKDPDCIHNLAGSAATAKERAKLKAFMEAQLKRQKDPRMEGNGDVFDRYPYADDRVRNFYQRYRSGEKIRAPWVEESDFEK